MLRPEFTAAMDVASADDLLNRVVAFTLQLGFDTVTVMAAIDSLRGETEFLNIHNAPAAYEHLLNDFEGGRCDPVMQHCKRSSVPIVWDRNTYARAGQVDKWEEQSRYGYSTGLALALHLPRGLHYMIGVDRDGPLPKDSAEVTRMVAELQLFASMGQEAALRALLPASRQMATPGLSRCCAGPWKARPRGSWAAFSASASRRRPGTRTTRHRSSAA